MADEKKSREVDWTNIVGMGNGCGNDTCYCTGACHGKSAKINPFEYTGGDNEVRIADGDSKPSNMTVKITADVGEALTGFKALQRELRETTKAARELESDYESLNKRIGRNFLSEVSTKELSEELAKREGVEELVVADHEALTKISLDIGRSDDVAFIEGPARILVNKV